MWVTVKNISKKFLNTETLNSDSCLQHFGMLCTKEDKSLLLNEIQILDPDYIDELEDDFTVQGMNKFILSMTNNKQQDVMVYQLRHRRSGLLRLKKLKF